MKRLPKGFTLIEAVVVIVVCLGISGMVSGPLLKSRRKALSSQCMNNERQMGMALLQFEMLHNAAPAFSKDSATTTTDGDLCAANLLRLYCTGSDDDSAGLVDDLQTFRCPAGAFAPTPADAAATPATVAKDRKGGKYASYNLTTRYSTGDPSNKIIVADMPFSKNDVNASAHDSTANAIDVGPNCLFKDGHVSNVRKLCPEGSSEWDLSPKGSIYRVDGGEGKGKDTCILGVER